MKLQSAKDHLYIYGSGFRGEPVLHISPEISSPANYTITEVSGGHLKLELVEGSLWSKSLAELLVTSINVGDGDVRRDAPSAVYFFLFWLTVCPSLFYLVIFMLVGWFAPFNELLWD